jgi:4-amino-4-deoxy-L-arabinose transferase-like glycosyltransferase
VRAFSYLEGQTDVTRRDGYLEALVAARFPALVANAVALGGMVWLACGLFGTGAAVLGGLLMVLDPFLGAHSRLIHLDGLLASFMGLAVLASMAFWSRSDRPRAGFNQVGRGWVYLVVAGLASGLAFLTKAPSVYLLAFVPALAMFQHVRTAGWRRWPDWSRLALGLAGWLGIAALTCLALWPALRLKPLVVVRQMADFTVRNAGSERDNFFLGQPVEDPGPLFYPLALLFRATPLMLLGMALLAYALVRWRRQLPAFWPALLLGAYAAGFLLMMSLGQKKFDRYELPIFPALNLLAGLGLWLGWRVLRARRRNRLLIVVPLLLLAAWPLASVYPYHLAYYNPLLGGGAMAQRALLVGWGEGIDRVADYLNAKPIVVSAPTVATAYHRVLQAYLRGNNAMPLERAELADYIVPYVNSIQRDQKAEVLAGYLAGQDPEHVVWLNGIEYARVYRGPHLPVDRLVGADLDGRLRLESLVFAPGSGLARAGDDLLIRLRWRASGDPGPLLSILQLVGPDGRPTIEERQPLGGAMREAELLVIDAQLHLPSSLPAGSFMLQALVDDRSSGRALRLPDGATALDLQQVTVQPAVAR